MMNPGTVVKSTSITKNLGPQNYPTQYRETYRAKRGYQFVFLLLGTEEFNKPIDPRERMHEMGWFENPPKPKKRKQ